MSMYLDGHETARLRIRPFTREDLPWIEREHANPEVTQFLMMNGGWTPKMANIWLTDLLGHYETEGMGHLALVRKSDGELVGRSGLSSWLIDGEVELGYTLAKPHWGNGYATEASQALRDYGYCKLGYERLISLIQQENVLSKKVATRNGFLYEQSIPRHERTFEIWGQSRDQWEVL
ncbi:MAG: GNAT family N-acetyltransferase [bacterium]